MENPLQFYEKAKLMPKNKYRHIIRSQLKSFGYGQEMYDTDLDKTIVQKWIEEIESEFDLILIMEHFDFSLALLALELCWPLEDLAYLRTNEGKKVKLAKKSYTEELIKVFNYPDYMLYEHFNASLWARIDAIGLEKIEQDLVLLFYFFNVQKYDFISKKKFSLI